MKTLAWHYAAGLNGEVSAKESIRWMRMAAEKGDPEAMFRYATALDLGFGVSADPQSAKSWHERAIKNGFVQ
ncbi:Sel1 repeat protein [compost metagenome]